MAPLATPSRFVQGAERAIVGAGLVPARAGIVQAVETGGDKPRPYNRSPAIVSTERSADAASTLMRSRVTTRWVMPSSSR